MSKLERLTRINGNTESLRLEWIVRNKKGAITFVVHTDITDDKPFYPEHKTRAIDFGIHSRKSLSHTFGPRDECEYLDGKPCHYDGSGLTAANWWRDWIGKPEAWIWEQLEEQHRHYLS